jgi:hypothetical protein
MGGVTEGLRSNSGDGPALLCQYGTAADPMRPHAAPNWRKLVRWLQLVSCTDQRFSSPMAALAGSRITSRRRWAAIQSDGLGDFPVANEKRSHAGPAALHCTGVAAPALAAATGWTRTDYSWGRQFPDRPENSMTHNVKKMQHHTSRRDQQAHCSTALPPHPSPQERENSDN